MGNLVPFGKNTPPTSPSFPGGLRPPVNNGLNSWNGPIWRNPANPTQIKPPPTSPLLRIPPKLPPVPKSPGLGILGAVFFDLVFPSPVSDGTLPPWYQPPPPPSTLPVVPFFDKNLPIGQSYRVFYDAELFAGGRTSEGSFVCQGPFSDFYEEVVLSDRIWGYGVRFWQAQPRNIFAEVGQAISMGNRMAYGTDIPLGQITNAVGAINIKRNTVKVTRIQRLSDNEFLDPMLPPTGPTPPYALAPESPNSPPLTSPGPQAPTPTNPVPFNPPGATPPFVPFPRPEKNNTGGENEPPKKEETPPWFSPFPALDPPFKEPFDFNPTDTPKTTGPYVVNDPVLDFGLNRPPNPLAHPIPIPDPAPIPTTDPNPNPTNPPNRQPTTTPGPNKDKNPIPFFPPFPIVNPTNPSIETPPNNPPPVNQTPPGNSCCVATPIDQKLNDANKLGDLGGATLYNLLTTPPDTAQLIGGFSPAKAILSQRLGTARTVSASSNRITGRAYKTSSGPSYTIPFGRQGASSFEFAAQSSIASSQQANYIATFTPERLRQKG